MGKAKITLSMLAVNSSCKLNDTRARGQTSNSKFGMAARMVMQHAGSSNSSGSFQGWRVPRRQPSVECRQPSVECRIIRRGLCSVVEASQGGLVTELSKHDVSSHVPFMEDPSQLLGYASGWLPSSTSFSSIPVPDRLLSKVFFGA